MFGGREKDFRFIRFSRCSPLFGLRTIQCTDLSDEAHEEGTTPMSLRDDSIIRGCETNMKNKADSTMHSATFFLCVHAKNLRQMSLHILLQHKLQLLQRINPQNFTPSLKIHLLSIMVSLPIHVSDHPSTSLQSRGDTIGVSSKVRIAILESLHCV